MSKRVLFLRGGAIGDFILTLPAMRLLVEQWPDSEIELLSHRAMLDLALATSHVRAGRCLDDPSLAHFFAPGAALDGAWVDYFASFDLIISFLHDPEGVFHANLRRADAKRLLFGIAKPQAPGVPAAIQLAAPLVSLNISVHHAEIYPRLNFRPHDHESARPYLSGEGDWIALHPGSGGKSKNWPLDCWREALRGTASEFPQAKFLIISGEAEEEMDAFTQSLALPASQARNLPLPVLGAALARCRLFLGHDSGISHLAAGTGCPSLLLFGPTDPYVWAPSNPGVQVIRAASGEMEDISVSMVERALAATLRTSNESGVSP